MLTHPLPHNAGKASEDTQDKPFPTALNGPFADPLFALLSAMQNSLWMRCQLYFRFNGFKLCYAYCTPIVSICQELIFIYRGHSLDIGHCTH